MEGLTVIVLPFPIGVPPQLLEYHSQVALEPSEPPETLSKQMSPGQIVLNEGIIAVGAEDRSCVFMVILMQLVVLQVPSALAK